MVSGEFFYSTEQLSIGQPGAGGMSYLRSLIGWGWRDNYGGTINADGTLTEYTVSFGTTSETFTLSGGVFTQAQGRGSTLTYNSGTQIYTYTSGDGVVATFVSTTNLVATYLPDANRGRVSTVTYPNGEKLTFSYRTVTVSSADAIRLQSVTNNFGYQIKFEYALNTPTTTTDFNAWLRTTKVTGVNNAIDYCSPTADTCTFSQTWPNVSFAPISGTASETATDTLGLTTRYTLAANSKLGGIRRPSASSDTTIITYDGNDRVATVSNGTGTWSYSYSDTSTERTTTVTDPLSHIRTVVSTIATGLVKSDTDGVGRTVSYQYDSAGRLTRITSPAGDYVTYAYDSRGNVTTVTNVAVSGSGLSNIVTSASYDSTCTYAAKCNKPNTTTDATGAVTNYTYDNTYGVLTAVAEPAATSGGTRPETRIGYTALYAYYKNSGGSIVAAASPVYLPASTSACVSGSSCSGASTEVKTTVTYGSTGVANNLLPTSVASGSGDGALTATTAMTWDAVGNRLAVDGPLSGGEDTTRYRYDDDRRLVGIVGPDPDGAGSLKFRALRNTYNSDGQVTSVDIGTVTAQTDGAWASMSVLQQTTITYDTLGRPTKQAFVAGGSTQAVLQYSYDAANRLECTAVRMNPSIFGSLPSSACTLGTTGSNGPDQITRNNYSAADEVTKVTTAYGVSGQAADEVSVTYNDWGQPATTADAMGGLTTYEYDGFGRLKKTRFPIAGTRTSSSSSDFELTTFDAYGRVSQEQRRDGSIFAVSYDLLNRPTTLDAPSGMNDVTYTYDLLGRPLTAAYSGHTLTYTWDALGRGTSAAGPQGTISYQYDLAGRRTRMIWPDGFYLDYDYDLAGEVTKERENGATSGGGVLATFTYDDLGRRTTLTRGNGVVTTYTFDSASRLTSLAQDLASTGSDQTYTLTYSANSSVLSRVGSNSAYAPSTPTNITRSYSSNGLNQLTVAGTASVTYSGNGNLTSDATNNYTYDAGNRLTGMSGVTLTYDPLGRLYETTGAATTRFAYDGADMVGEYNASGTLLRRYVHGPGTDEPLVWYEGSGTSDRRWLVTDQLGSVVAVTDGSGAAITINSYGEYGIPGSGNAGRFQYTGQTWISEIGLYNYKARFYAPTFGRFMQIDPIGYGDGMNLYAYVGNDPINFVDPPGTTRISEPMPGYYCDEEGPYSTPSGGAGSGDCWFGGDIESLFVNVGGDASGFMLFASTADGDAGSDGRARPNPQYGGARRKKCQALVRGSKIAGTGAVVFQGGAAATGVFAVATRNPVAAAVLGRLALSQEYVALEFDVVSAGLYVWGTGDYSAAGQLLLGNLLGQSTGLGVVGRNTAGGVSSGWQLAMGGVILVSKSSTFIFLTLLRYIVYLGLLGSAWVPNSQLVALSLIVGIVGSCVVIVIRGVQHSESFGAGARGFTQREIGPKLIRIIQSIVGIVMTITLVSLYAVSVAGRFVEMEFLNQFRNFVTLVFLLFVFPYERHRLVTRT